MSSPSMWRGIRWLHADSGAPVGNPEINPRHRVKTKVTFNVRNCVVDIEDAIAK